MSNTGLQKSIHTVAVLEAIKGAVVLIAGFGLLELLHKDAHAVAYEIVSRLHLNPARKFPRIFIDLFSSITDARLWFLASMAALYSAFRFVEAYGLWKERVWASWLALVSGAVYLPIEVYHLSHKITVVRVSLFIANLVVVGVVGAYMLQERKKKIP